MTTLTNTPPPTTGLRLIREWFTSQDRVPFSFQERAWAEQARGNSGLIHASTGTGKTYAAWLGTLINWIDAHPDRSTWKGTLPPPLTALWITPLRALAADTEEALRAPITDLGLPWILESRTGDTSSKTRNAQRKRLPSALVTTPESLSLLLTRPDAAELFKSLKTIVIDEWHELAASKRGVQTELALARLRHFAPGLQTWGLSATLGNLDTALKVLLGVNGSGVLIEAELPKKLTVKSILPPKIEHFPWSGHLGTRLLPQVADVIEDGRSALLFTNTRAQAELWYQALLDYKPEWAGLIALHHSAIERKTREWVEDGLRDGRILCAVCTSSLDLGVDFSPVDNVIQIGSPKGVGRLVQRAGRSGHRPGAESLITFVPTNAFELVEIAAARDAITRGDIESRAPHENPLDVLAQHAVTVATGGGFTRDELYNEVRTTYAYRDLRSDEWDWILDFITRGGPALQAYPEYSRVALREDGRYEIADKDAATRHRMNIGTIVSEASLKVQYLNGATLGYVEESFAARLKPGDRFVFAGKLLEFSRIREMTIWVRRATKSTNLVPRWAGSRLAFSTELADAVRLKLEEARKNDYHGVEMENIEPILRIQSRWSLIPAPNQLLIERLQTREGYHLFFYPFEGRLANEGLAALFAYRISQIAPITFAISANDYGFELLSPDEAPLEEAIRGGLFQSSDLLTDLMSSLNASEMARRQFREIARIAGLIFQGYPGSQKSAKQLQASSSLIYEVFEKYDPENKLLDQAGREVLERQLERGRLGIALEKFRAGRVTIKRIPRLTPFAFPLFVELIRDRVTSESLEDRIRKMQLQLERAADDPRLQISGDQADNQDGDDQADDESIDFSRELAGRSPRTANPRVALNSTVSPSPGNRRRRNAR